MWLGHSIEQLVCIGGELEHHQALSPSAARKNRAVCSALMRGGIYRHLIGPGWWHKPGLMGSPWSRFVWTFGPGWWDEPGPMSLAPGQPSLVPVGGLNRDQRLPFSPGSCHQPGLMRCLYIPLAREQSTPVLCFSLAEGERAWWCSSSPPMHTRCSMECPSHTT